MRGVNPCYYCGMAADSVDHVVPRTIAERLPEVELVSDIRTYTVPCCRECNCILGPKLYATLADKKHALKKILRKRYKKYLTLPDWTEEDMQELGPTLQPKIRAGQSVKILTQQRLVW